jgi:chemotaxis protein histidine kinase CheA
VSINGVAATLEPEAEMPDKAHVLVVRAGVLAWAFPMSAVEQTFDLRDHAPHLMGRTVVVSCRGKLLELVDVAERLGYSGESTAAVVARASGRVETLLERLGVGGQPVA